MSIKDNLSKIKPLWKTASLGLLLAVCSFGVGRLSALHEVKAPIVLGVATDSVVEQEKTAQISNISPKAASIESEGIVVGSKQGKTYHFPWCSGAKRIAQENKITFASQAEAQKAGYAPAKNCKGLVADPQ